MLLFRFFKSHLYKVTQLILAMVILGCLVPPKNAQAQNKTPNYWNCVNRVGGSWAFGVAPDACDANAFGSDSFITANYAPVIFNEKISDKNAERFRYMQEIYSALTEAAERYLKQRKPGVSAEEMNAFKRTVHALAHGESLFTQYRAYTDGRLKMIRGDSGHGHGLMQLDDRYHFAAVSSGTAWNLMRNFTYSIELLYSGWQVAPSKACMAGANNTWRNRGRAAWASYNGGPSKICRWANPNDAWARNDRNFAQHYDSATWNDYVMNKSKPASIHIACLMDGGTQCPALGVPPSSDVSLPDGTLVASSTGGACVISSGRLYCIDALRDANCLTSNARILSVPPQQLAVYPVIKLNRHQQCHSTHVGLVKVGGFIQRKQPLPFRAAPDAAIVGQAPVGSYQVSDFEVSGAQGQRAYRIQLNGEMVYVDAGNNSTYSSLTAPAAKVTSALLIPTQGDVVKVNNASGATVRATPSASGAVIGTLGMGSQVSILDVYWVNSTNEIYYLIEFKGTEGWIYAGYELPVSSRSQWVSLVLPADVAKSPAYCPAGTRYDSSVSACSDSKDAYGAFTQAMIKSCIESGSGIDCSQALQSNLNGQNVDLWRWESHFTRALHGGAECAQGSTRSERHRFRCVESVNVNGQLTEHIFGPFAASLVNRCVASGGGAACYTNRWSGSFYLALLKQ
jgi:hypothetical protein